MNKNISSILLKLPRQTKMKLKIVSALHNTSINHQIVSYLEEKLKEAELGLSITRMENEDFENR